MKILYLHQYFKTPEEGGGIRSYHLSKKLVAIGHQVVLITTHNHSGYQIKNIQGVEVHYLPITYANEFGFIARIKAFLQFVWKAFQVARKIPNIEICYATSTPLTVGIVALLLKRTKRIPYFFEVRDLWPQAPIELGILKNPILILLAKCLEKLAYQQSEKIIALSPGIQEAIREIVPQKEIVMIPNMSDLDFWTEAYKMPVQKFDAVPNNLVVAYFGTIGLANHLEYFLEIVDCANKYHQDEYYFYIIGEGKYWKKIRQQAEKLKIYPTPLNILNPQNKHDLRSLLHRVDVVYVSYWQKKVLETSSPNKFFDALAAGKIVVVNTKGWLQDLVEENGCGFYIDPKKPEDFFERLSPFRYHADLQYSYQQNALKLAKEQFSKEMLSEQFTSLFES